MVSTLQSGRCNKSNYVCSVGIDHWGNRNHNIASVKQLFCIVGGMKAAADVLAVAGCTGAKYNVITGIMDFRKSKVGIWVGLF